MNKTTEFSFLLKPSTIPDAGVGIFATHDIAQGTKLRLLPDDYQSRKLKESEIPKEFIIYCVAKDDDIWSCPADFGRMEVGWFINHSKDPNIERRENAYYAKKNIKKSEELLLNYNDLNEPEEKKESYYKQ